MQALKASLWRGETALVQDLTVYLEETTDSSGIRSWYGVFQLPHGADLDPTAEGYRLKLHDGRKGRIVIRTVNMSSHSFTQVSFVGSGALKQEVTP
jgi:hypothetical protein